MKKLISGGKILRRGLPFVAVALIYIALSTQNMSPYDRARSGAYIYSELEHVMMSLTLLVGGELLFDLTLREKRR